MDQSLIDKITRVRRQTRSQDILDICDALEKSIQGPLLPDNMAQQLILPKLPFDKTSYQREYMRGYMRKRRAKA